MRRRIIMAAYIYKAATLEGKIVEGTMEAPDNGAVALKLQDMGLLPIRVAMSARKSLMAREIELPVVVQMQDQQIVA